MSLEAAIMLTKFHLTGEYPQWWKGPIFSRTYHYNDWCTGKAEFMRTTTVYYDADGYVLRYNKDAITCIMNKDSL